jgi:uncharacterized protein (DUF58 family)
MNYVLIFIFSVFMLCPQTAVFARNLPKTKIKATVDKTALAAEELLTYRLTVVSNEKNLPVKLPDFIDFSIVSLDESASFQQEGMQTIRVFVFVLSPQKTGKLVIEPAQVTVLGKVHSSRNFKIKVRPFGAPVPERPAPQEESAQEMPEESPPEMPDSPQEMPDSGWSQYNL